MNPHYPLVAARAAHRCEYCRAPEVIFNCPFEVEHIIPPSRGGLDEEANWALSCRACNVRKSNHLDAVDPETATQVRLYNPRDDAWQEHFTVDHRSGTISGTTAVGRATVQRLGMNTPTQTSARLQWVRLGLFP